MLFEILTVITLSILVLLALFGIKWRFELKDLRRWNSVHEHLRSRERSMFKKAHVSYSVNGEDKNISFPVLLTESESIESEEERKKMLEWLEARVTERSVERYGKVPVITKIKLPGE